VVVGEVGGAQSRTTPASLTFGSLVNVFTALPSNATTSIRALMDALPFGFAEVGTSA